MQPLPSTIIPWKNTEFELQLRPDGIILLSKDQAYVAQLQWVKRKIVDPKHRLPKELHPLATVALKVAILSCKRIKTR
jgi:hypothetical protein